MKKSTRGARRLAPLRYYRLMRRATAILLALLAILPRPPRGLIP